ncbi:MAG TPA: cytochrome c [Gammaproteobacteria bacterium]|nr:cytochrome c [Gammaproteobacteria bacterium]
MINVSTPVYVAVGILVALGTASATTWLLPDENHVIPPPGVGGYPAKPVEPGQIQQANPQTVELGRVYFAQICLPCHGVRGDGMGEWAYRVTPKPADLRSTRVQSRSDTQLFDIISDGLVGTPMIGWKTQLSERQRWDVIAYLRTLPGNEESMQ